MSEFQDSFSGEVETGRLLEETEYPSATTQPTRLAAQVECNALKHFLLRTQSPNPGDLNFSGTCQGCMKELPEWASNFMASQNCLDALMP